MEMRLLVIIVGILLIIEDYVGLDYVKVMVEVVVSKYDVLIVIYLDYFEDV